VADSDFFVKTVVAMHLPNTYISLLCMENMEACIEWFNDFITFPLMKPPGVFLLSCLVCLIITLFEILLAGGARRETAHM
jgi:hypothetical protein